MTPTSRPNGRSDDRMPKSLIIVESPAKARTIERILKEGYEVRASYGHVRDLPESADEIPDEIRKKKWGRLGVDTDGDFTPHYVIPNDKKKYVQALRASLKGATQVYLATDPDREGESISWHLREVLKPKVPVKRIVFHEITERGVTEAMQQPQKVDENLVASQRARRVMDRIVGYKVTPLVWKTFFYGLSAGRVQSVALRLIAEREHQIGAFLPTEYWTIIGEFTTRAKESFYAKLFRIDPQELFVPSKETLAEIHHKGTSSKYTYIPSEAEALRHVGEIQRQSFAVADVQKRESRRNPYAPFITSTLQQEASRKLGLSAKRTMMLAQKLYEGIEIGDEGLVGHAHAEEEDGHAFLLISGARLAGLHDARFHTA